MLWWLYIKLPYNRSTESWGFHHSLLTQYCFCCADINDAVEDLASLHEENYIKFCLNQLNKWLQPKGLRPDLLEDTCGLTRLLQNYKKVDDNDEDNLLRYKEFLFVLQNC
jgi:hypothetical protein